MIKAIIIGALVILGLFPYCCLVAAKRADEEIHEMFEEHEDRNTGKDR